MVHMYGGACKPTIAVWTGMHKHSDVLLCHQHQRAHNVEELAQLVQLGARPDQALCEVARVAGGKADALDAWHIMHMAQQVCERPRSST